MIIASGPNDALVLLWPLFHAQQSLSRAPEKACGCTKRVRLLTWRNFEMCVSHVVSHKTSVAWTPFAFPILGREAPRAPKITRGKLCSFEIRFSANNLRIRTRNAHDLFGHDSPQNMRQEVARCQDERCTDENGEGPAQTKTQERPQHARRAM